MKNPFKKDNKVAANQTRPQLKGSFAHRLVSDPFLDWVLIFSFALVAMMALVGVGIYVYLLTGAKLDAEVAPAKPAAMPLDEAKLGSVLREFDSRAEHTTAILRTYSAPRDPSLP